jgi:hypothetical protein
LAFGAYSSALTFNGEVYIWGIDDLRVPTLQKSIFTAETVEPSLNKISIPSTLFKDFKISDHTLVS